MSILNETNCSKTFGTVPASVWLTLRWRVFAGCILGGLACAAPRVWAGSTPADPGAAERGRAALLQHSYLKAEWKIDAYRNAGKLWGTPAPDPDQDAEGYARAFALHYGLHPAPYPNDGLPMGLRWSKRPDGTKTGIQVDCMACHGGSIGGKSYLGLPNTQVDYELLFGDLFRAEGRRVPLLPFIINSARGTTNAGMMAVVLLSVRNPDLSRRKFPLLLGANLPELDAPPWWNLKRKKTMYYDGRTPAASVRANMQFLLGEKTLEQFQALEPTFRDIQAYLLSLQPPKYPLAIEAAGAERGKAVFEQTCARCHGTYGASESYPSKIAPLDVIGTDPARSMGISDRAVAHYNATWFGANYAVDAECIGYQAPPLDGIWASAPYLHNGSVPTLHSLLKSSTRPRRFARPPSTDFEHYDTRQVGWRFRELTDKEVTAMKSSAHTAHFLYDTSHFGLGNRGHTFGDKLTDDQRMDLIEYLKTL
jgi:mono/diheme cytochrome c family protein